MYSIEFHDDDLDHPTLGTLIGYAGQGGNIDREYQAELYMYSLKSDSLSRAYIFKHGRPLVVWDYSRESEFVCIGHTLEYEAAWQYEFPYVFPDAMSIESERFGKNVSNLDEGYDWANEKLIGSVATAILYGENGVIAAWEKHYGYTHLVACGRTGLQEMAASSATDN